MNMTQQELDLFSAPTTSRRFRYGYDRVSGFDDYDPRECRRRILSVVGAQWVGFTSLVCAVRMRPQPVNHMLILLVRWGRLEKHELYFGPYTSPDRLTKPPLGATLRVRGGPPAYKYQGFEWGFRLRTRPGSAQCPSDPT